MEHLPTETLLNIFRFIEDGRTLLDGVSRVCSRWNSVAKDPRAWAGVKLRLFTSKDDDCRVPVSEARVVSRAPALAQLTVHAVISVYRFRDDGEAMASLETALSRCKASIQSVVCGDIFHLSTPILKNLFAVLKRNKKNIRELSVRLRGHRSHHKDVLDCIASLEKLQELRVESNTNPNYAGQLKGRLPALRVLLYTLTANVNQEPQNHSALLQDALDAGAESLRRVQIDLVLPPAVVLSLSKCTKLSSLTVNAGALVAVRGMASLRELAVTLRPLDSVPPRDLELLDSASLPALRVLIVSTNGASAGTRRDAALLAVGRAAPGVTTLHVDFDRQPQVLAAFSEAVAELLGTLPRLTHVSLSPGGPSAVPRLMALEQLETVRIKLSVRAQHMQECCQQLRELKRLRPGLVGTVRVTPIQEREQSFTWRKPRNF